MKMVKFTGLDGCEIYASNDVAYYFRLNTFKTEVAGP